MTDIPWTLWLLRAQVLFFALMLFGLLGHKLGWLSFAPAFYSFGLSLLLLALAGLVALIAFLVSFAMDSPSWRSYAGWAALLGWLPPIVIVLLIGPANFAVPPIHDISTDLEQVPEFVAAHDERGEGANSLEHGGEALAQAQRSAYPDIRPIETDLDPQQAYQRSLTVAEQLGWEVLDADPAAGRIEAVEETTFFGFKDDVVIRVRAQGQGSRVDLRSVSRVGQSDLGANAARIRRFREAFAAATGG